MNLMRKVDTRQNPSALATKLTAKVDTIWLSNPRNGNGYHDAFWHLSLVVPGWPSQSNQLFARSRHALQLEKGSLYDLEGETFLDSGNGFSYLYLLIDSATESTADGQYKRPIFSLLAEVKLTAYNQVLLYWTTWDDYEQTKYGQTAIVSCSYGVDRLLNKKCVFKGEMASGDQVDWFCGTIETFWL